MVTGIDHLVIAVSDLDAAAHELEQQIGLAVTGGGRHLGAGTANRIAFLADGSYLELMVVEDREAALLGPVGAAAVRTREAYGSGLAAYALLDDHLETTVAELQANGSSIGPVQHGSRMRPDGELVEWWSAFPESIGPDGIPFLIRHANTGAEWGPAAMAERRSFAHPIGSPVVLARLDLATPDPSDLAARYARELGVEFWAVVDLAVSNVGRHVIRLVPSREMELPAVVTLGAQIEAPRSAEVLGLRVDLEPVAIPAAVAG
jgi:catechol 2,3-dioxygenase-like lactoylglutathione lyase family enzyme